MNLDNLTPLPVADGYAYNIPPEAIVKLRAERDAMIARIRDLEEREEMYTNHRNYADGRIEELEGLAQELHDELCGQDYAYGEQYNNPRYNDLIERQGRDETWTTFAKYQRDAARTLGDWADASPLHMSLCANGLTGEAGEVADMIKKVYGHGHPLDREKLMQELGDVFWYMSAMASMIRATLDEIAGINIKKLRTRFPNGFNHADSIKRLDVAK